MATSASRGIWSEISMAHTSGGGGDQGIETSGNIPFLNQSELDTTIGRNEGMKNTERHLFMLDVSLGNAEIPMDDQSNGIDVPSRGTIIQVNLNQHSNGASCYLVHLIEVKDSKMENVSFILGRIGNIDQSDTTTTKSGINHL